MGLQGDHTPIRRTRPIKGMVRAACYPPVGSNSLKGMTIIMSILREWPNICNNNTIIAVVTTSDSMLDQPPLEILSSLQKGKRQGRQR